jgi:hypothetical protein
MVVPSLLIYFANLERQRAVCSQNGNRRRMELGEPVARGLLRLWRS